MIGLLNGQYVRYTSDGIYSMNQDEGHRAWHQIANAINGTNYKFPDDCDHGTKIFNGYVWHCKDCGVNL